MKIPLLFALSLTLLALEPAVGQTSGAVPSASTSPTGGIVAERKEATGTITELTPERSLVLQTDSDDGEPLVFRFAREVTYVDKDGKTLEAAGLRKNLRVRVSYAKIGGDYIADRVTILE